MLPNTARTRRLGAIDIGTNTIKLLIADTDGRTISPVCQKSIQTRLGAGLSESNHLSQQAIDRTRNVFFDYLSLAKELSTECLIGNATSAVRDADNGKQFVKQLEEETGTTVMIISGDKEADLIYRGINSAQSTSSSEHRIILDVGGGSTELILAIDQTIAIRESYNVGSVRLLEQSNLVNPLDLNQRDAIDRLISSHYAPLIDAATPYLKSNSTFDLIAAGGGAVAASMLLSETADFFPEQIESAPLKLTDLQQLNHKLWTSSLEDRRGWPGMPKERADILPIGIAIFTNLLRSLELKKLHVSTRGLRFGLLLQQYESPL